MAKWSETAVMRGRGTGRRELSSPSEHVSIMYGSKPGGKAKTGDGNSRRRSFGEKNQGPALNKEWGPRGR